MSSGAVITDISTSAFMDICKVIIAILTERKVLLYSGPSFE